MKNIGMLKLKGIVIVVFIVLFINDLCSQYYFTFNQDIPVIVEGDTLKNPWAGGLNHVQVSKIDYDFDADEDLFLFDRSSNNIRLFKNVNNNHFEFVVSGKNYFPSDLTYRVALVDYNNDGKKDIFTYGIGGIKVYKNTGNLNIGLQWAVAKNILYSNYSGNETNLYVSSSDIPAIVDVDFDGDFDVLTYEINGQHIEYHQNQSVELYGVPDSLKFELKNRCWGKFTENIVSSVIELNSNIYPCNTGGVSDPEYPVINDELSNDSPVRHSGSTILAIDVDDSGVYDLLLGDVEESNLNLLINGGTAPNTNSAMISVDESFPSNSNTVDLKVFPAAFYEDVDFDGTKDLLIGSNARNASENRKSLWFYKNNGTNELPVFNYQQEDFLQDNMIDVGAGSIPTFMDYDNDGLEDLFVSNFMFYDSIDTRKTSISVYKNTGTSNSPSFTWITDDFLNLSNNPVHLRNVPAFGDLDNDGDKDIVMGKSDGTLHFYECIDSPNLNFSNPIIGLTDSDGNIITAGSYSFPQLFDLNEDGLLDLILGKMDGTISYFQNIGTLTNYSFKLMNNQLGGVVSNNTGTYTSPHFFKDHDSLFLFVGDIEGNLFIYDQVRGNIEMGESFHLQSQNVNGIQVEGYSSFWVNDLDENGKIDLFVGQDLGGIFHYEYDLTANIKTNEKLFNQFEVYPNPSNGSIKIKSDIEDYYELRITDLNGQIVKMSFNLHKNEEIDLTDLMDGIYILNVKTSNGNIEFHRIVIQK